MVPDLSSTTAFRNPCPLIRPLRLLPPLTNKHKGLLVLISGSAASPRSPSWYCLQLFFFSSALGLQRALLIEESCSVELCPYLPSSSCILTTFLRTCLGINHRLPSVIFKKLLSLVLVLLPIFFFQAQLHLDTSRQERIGWSKRFGIGMHPSLSYSAW